MNRHFPLFLLPILLCAGSIAAGDTVTLKNGDRLSGTVTEESAASVVLDSPVLGLIEIPGEEVAEVTRALEEKPEEPATEPEPDMSLSEKYWEELTSAIFPEGFSGEITVGYNYSESSDTQSGVVLGLAGNYEIGKHTVDAKAFYEYTRKKSAEGVVTKPTDKYGANAAYEYDIQEPFFLRGSEKLLVDRVKKINLQNDINALLGWRAVDRDDFSVDLAAGPGVRYLDTTSNSGEWSSLATFNQDAFYRFNDSLRFNQQFDYSVDPSDTGAYSLLFELSASVRLTPFAEPKLIYRNSYDSTVGEGGVKREQQLILALAVPF